MRNQMETAFTSEVRGMVCRGPFNWNRALGGIFYLGGIRMIRGQYW